MNRRKPLGQKASARPGMTTRISSGHLQPKRRRVESESPKPIRRKCSQLVQPPPEFPKYDYDKNCPTLSRITNGNFYTFHTKGYSLVATELEDIYQEMCRIAVHMKGELQFINEGEYPKLNLDKRIMPDVQIHRTSRSRTATPFSEDHPGEESNIPEEETSESVGTKEICLLPNDNDEDDLNDFPPYFITTRFWTWLKAQFMKDIDEKYLNSFKEVILDGYSNEAMQKLLLNEPWRHRKKPVTTRSKPGSSKTPKRVSIANDLSTSEGTNRSSTRKNSLSGYRIPNRRNSEKDATNNNKIVPMIGSMVISACREFKESKSAPETPSTPTTTSKRRCRKISRDESKDRLENGRKNSIKHEPMEIDVDETNGVDNGTRISPRLNSPRYVKKERIDDDYEKMANGNGNGNHHHINGDCASTSTRNGHYSNGSTISNGVYVNGKTNTEGTSKRKNGEMRNGMMSARSLEKETSEELETLSDLEDFDAKAIGSRIVDKLIAGGILPESSAQIFEQLAKDNGAIPNGVTTKVVVSEEGRDELEDTDMDELSKEMERVQLQLQDELPSLNALVALTWRKAKAQFAFTKTFQQMREADYDLFKLSVNMYHDVPRRVPTNGEMPLLSQALIRRNRAARFHYGNTYRRHPKYRYMKASRIENPKASPSPS